MRSKPTARGFAFGSIMEFAVARDITSHTILSVATSERTRGTGSQSNGGGTRGIPATPIALLARARSARAQQ